MDIELSNKLYQICSELIREIEFQLPNYKLNGTCYLLGHCISEGLSKSGFIAKEITGILILKDKNGKSLVYGTSKYRGKLIGYYHTWCILEIDDEKIIIDPSLRYVKDFIHLCNHKPNQNIPDCLVSENETTWYYKYIEDPLLIPKSKHFLNLIKEDFIDLLVRKVMKSVNVHLK